MTICEMITKTATKPMTAPEICEATGIKKGSLRMALDRMVHRGKIIRTSHPHKLNTYHVAQRGLINVLISNKWNRELQL